jgi:hypothetical protein
MATAVRRDARGAGQGATWRLHCGRIAGHRAARPALRTHRRVGRAVSATTRRQSHADTIDNAATSAVAKAGEETRPKAGGRVEVLVPRVAERERDRERRSSTAFAGGTSSIGRLA